MTYRLQTFYSGTVSTLATFKDVTNIEGAGDKTLVQGKDGVIAVLLIHPGIWLEKVTS